MWAGMITILGLLIWAGYALVAGSSRRRGNKPGEGTGAPRRILDKRLARREIDAEEYQRLRDLTDAGNGQAPAGTRDGR